jgi:hypothetical protein
MSDSLISKEIHAKIVPPGVALISRYVRVQQVLDGYPFKRAKLYELLATGRIKSFSLKERGALRGIRLIDRESLDEFLEHKAAEASQAASPKKAGTEKAPTQQKINSEEEAEEGLDEITYE